MEFEQLHLKTVELLAAKAAAYGLPPVVADEANEDDASPAPGDYLLANALASAIREVREQEMPLAERQEAPEVVALRSNMQRLRMLKERMGSCQSTMGELRTAYEGVTARTSSLHDACDRALAHQTALAAGAEQIKTNLHFFKQADLIMKKLNNTSKLSVTGQTFTGILASIDECITFLRHHPEYKESATYIAKYEQCLSRAMTWIRVGVMADLEASVNDVRDRQAQLQVDYAKLGRGGADDDTFALLYGVFASRANSVKSALSVAEQRFSHVEEFQAMLAECQQAYFLTRYQLLAPIIQSTLSHLATVHGESSCALTRGGCAFVLRVCDDEFRLYRQFFSPDGPEGDVPMPRHGRVSPTGSLVSQMASLASVHPFEDFTESLCRLLYDMLRPIVIHNPHLETLAELCTILKVEMIEERCSLMSSMVADDRSAFDPRAGFVHVMGELVGDVAERIVYRAEAYGVSDIAGYKPAAGDLAYPEKLEMMKNIEAKKNSPPPLPVAIPSEPSTAPSLVPDDSAGNEASVVETASTAASSAEAISSVDDITPTEGAEVVRVACASTPESLVRKESTFSTGSNGGRVAATSAVDLHCLWYPTVRRTVMCLAKLFRCLDLGVFQSIARDLLVMCCESLDAASAQIVANPSKKGPSKQLDSELFMVKHLLILREQTTPYRQAASHRADATLPTREYSLDFTSMKNSLEDRDRWFELSSNNSLLALLFSMPVSVSEQSGDSRQVIDVRLRAACNQLISSTTTPIIAQLADWIETAEAELRKPDFDLKKHPSLSPSQLHELSKAAFKALTTMWPLIRSKFSLYIGAMETEGILLAPVRARIENTFSRVNQFALEAYDEDERQIAALPTLRQVSLIM